MLLAPIDLSFGDADRLRVPLRLCTGASIPSVVSEDTSRKDNKRLMGGAEVAVPATHGLEGLAERLRKRRRIVVGCLEGDEGPDPRLADALVAGLDPVDLLDGEAHRLN